MNTTTLAEKLIARHKIKAKDTLSIEVALDEAFVLGGMAGRNNDKIYNSSSQYIKDTADADFIKLLCEVVSTGYDKIPVSDKTTEGNK